MRISKCLIFLSLAVAALTLGSRPVFAWPSCPSNAEWVQVPSGTTSSITSGIGSLDSSGGVLFECEATDFNANNHEYEHEREQQYQFQFFHEQRQWRSRWV